MYLSLPVNRIHTFLSLLRINNNDRRPSVKVLEVDSSLWGSTAYMVFSFGMVGVFSFCLFDHLCFIVLYIPMLRIVPGMCRLVSQPALEAPFEHIGMDLIRSFQRSAHSYRFVLVLVDYATRYLDAVFLCTISAKSVAQALFQVVYQVSIPKKYGLTRARHSYLAH